MNIFVIPGIVTQLVTQAAAMLSSKPSVSIAHFRILLQHSRHVNTLVIGTTNAWCGNCSQVAKFSIDRHKRCTGCSVEWRHCAVKKREGTHEDMAIRLSVHIQLFHLPYIGVSTGRAANRDGVHYPYFKEEYHRPIAS